MSELRHERIARLCEQLRLVAVTSQYASLADEAVQREASLAEFLENVLRSELDVRQSRSRHTLMVILPFLGGLKSRAMQPFSVSASGLCRRCPCWAVRCCKSRATWWHSP